tara:strand:- start:901 stop:1383 length:483 start_codon:yes stop_codon:yes gene_type:complete
MNRNYIKVIEGYPDYTISESGEILSYRGRSNGKILKHSVDKIGYCNVGLTNNLGKKTLSVHKTMAIMFLGYKSNKGVTDVHHIDGDKTNNHLYNLEIINHRDNVALGRRGKLGVTGISKKNNAYGFIITYTGIPIARQGYNTIEEAEIDRTGLLLTIKNI